MAGTCLPGPGRWQRNAAAAFASSLVISVAVGACRGSSPTAPATNAAPAVTVAFQGASNCIPLPATPCTLDVVGQASDPDRDPLTYRWSGCATGTTAKAVCTVDRPGPVIASVEVSDAHGHTVSTSVSGTGTNRPPGVQIGYATLLPNGFTIELLGSVEDPDEGHICGAKYCVSAAASGACGGVPVFLDCSCLGELEAQLRRTATTGICNVTFTLKDSWGEVGTPTFSFDLGKLAISSASLTRE